MTPKTKNIIVGIFVVVLSLGMIFFVTWMGSTAIQEESEIYIVYLDEAVSGLSPNAPVKYKGVNIGQVSVIQINPNNSNQVELQLRIRQGAPIKQDSTAVLTAQGITGLQYIEITGGSQDMPMLQPQDEGSLPVIPAGKSTLATVEAAIGPILTNINYTIADIREILKNTNPEHLEHILADVQTVTGSFADHSDDIFQDVRDTANGLNQITQETNTLITDLRGFFKVQQRQFTSTMSDIQKLTTRLNHLIVQVDNQNVISEFNKTIRDLDYLIQTLNGKRNGKGVMTVTQELETTLQEVQTLSRTLGRIAEESDIATTLEELRITLQEVQELSQTLNQVADEVGKRPSALLFGNSKEEIRITQ